MHESKMQYLIDFMKTNLSVLETCIYIVRSTKMQNLRSEEIYKSIGSELEKAKNIEIVTSGFYDAGHLHFVLFIKLFHLCKLITDITIACF